jgi:Cu(I)/Ag(I) efflux system periplasmic protein CusF
MKGDAVRYLLCAGTLLVALPSTPQMANAEPTIVAQAAQPAGATVDGEVQKVDKEAGKITLKHGPIPNLDMPGMTMVFRVKDPVMLDSVKVGDKVRFSAERVGGALTVTQMTPLK